ncbi:CRAL/TRIO domain-containing protein [Didymella exigua CBS 183.55]|uniref:CRAL/TRIO domain-containing protein n=1 Tax=Didymella exigua CBS 183.55 TaxID=1150837 RepID=A0A6A5R453_9PLEO|nr:CRAL/TRIO domain-containing protein [Didymella exigua CBS 183.55]KAF1922865.1 CRAL/TRIO domain-containing protein [Didymella exigua CBS 183.55]
MTTMGPIAEPAPSSTPAPPAALTAEQQTKYDELLGAVRAWESLPVTAAKGAELTPLDDGERMWLTRECLLRYLRATKWNPTQAATRLGATAVWRREFGTEKLSAAYISPENEKGKQVQLGFDKAGRPCLYLLPQNQNTKPGPRQVEHLVYMLERTIDLHPPGQESLALLIDFRNTSSGGTPGLGIAKQVLDILQNHYPERLGRALLTHLPWYVSIFLKAINPFIDPVTKEKIKYNEPLTDHVPAEQLMAASGGAVDFKYDHDVYWPALEKLAADRRARRVGRWEQAGKLVGESEVYLWGGDEQSVGAATPAVGAATSAVGAATSAVGAATPAVGAATPAVGAATSAVAEEQSEAVKAPQPTGTAAAVDGEQSVGAAAAVGSEQSVGAAAAPQPTTTATAAVDETAPLSDSAAVPPPVHAPSASGDAALAADVAKLQVKDAEAPTPAVQPAV